MTRKAPKGLRINGRPVNLIIEAESPQQCDYCGTIRELRPYGRNGATICVPCATKPENIEITIAMFKRRMDDANV